MLELPRRAFVASGTALTLSTGLSADTSRKVTIALLGPGGMGTQHLRLLAKRADVRIAYLCDVDANRLKAAVASVRESSGHEPKGVSDMRIVFADKEVEAVWIATPDHWHGPATLLALDAGKHVYVEKPCCHNLREGTWMVASAERNRRVVQVGTQSRSSPTVQQAIQMLRDGVIGDVLVAKAWNSQLRGNIGKKKPSDPPAELDYDTWVGPAPMQPYQSNLLPGVWRFWRNFGVGDIGNDGIHELDVARWGLGVHTHPDTVAALGSKFFFDDDQEFADTQYCVFEYGSNGRVGQKRQLIFEQRDWSPYVQEGHENGNAFYGTKGMLILGKGSGFEVYGPRNKLITKVKGGVDLNAHHDNFLACVRGGAKPNASVEEGHRSAALAHLANIACLVGRTLRFDPVHEQVVGDAEANKLLGRAYRAGHWGTPKQG